MRTPALAALILLSLLGTRRSASADPVPDLDQAVISAPAPAQEQPTSPNALTEGGEAFVENMVDRALSQSSLKRDPAPGRKRVERVVIVANDIVGPEDPYPDLANTFHATTVPEVINRELLFKRGDRWDPELIAESARNLRNNLFLATATIVPAIGSRPDTVVALVVTKDLWSLRPEMSFSIVGTQLQILEAHPSEYNLAGRNKVLGGDFRMDLATYSAGLHYTDPRIFGSRLSTAESGSIIWNRDTSAMEGGTANFSFGQPLYSLSSEWAWNVSASYLKDIYRLYQDGDLAGVLIPSTGDILPYEFGRRVVQEQASVTRSFGFAFKQNLTFGWRGVTKDYALPTVASSIKPASLTIFEQNIMPYTESFGELFLQYAAFRSDYKVFIDIETFGLPEDFQFGPNINFGIAAANPAFGYDSTFIAPSASLSYLWLIGEDDLFSLGVSASARHEPGLWEGSDWVDESTTVSARNVSSRFSIFRLVSSAFVTRRVHDLDHNVSDLGSDTSLRGFPSAYLIGPNVWGANFELRSEPWAIRTVHIGGVAFVDMGDTFASPADLSTFSSVGLGLRVGMPQINRPVFRLDFGIPLQQLAQTPAYVAATFGQAF